MATKKRSNLPPMFPRVDVRRAFGDHAVRERVFDALRQVDELDLIEEIGAFVRIERGALLRTAAHLPKDVREAAQFGVDLFTLLEYTVRMVTRDLDAMRELGAGSEHVKHIEKVLPGQIQVLMDWAHKTQTILNWQALVSVAGIGGCDVRPLRRFLASSGIEATCQIVHCIERAVRTPLKHPFLVFGLSRSAQKRRLLQRGREKPISPRATDADDRAILLAVAAGKDTAKAVAGATKNFGQGSSTSHVNKRKSDLRRWGLLLPLRSLRLSPEGQEWVRLLGSQDGART